VEALVKLPAALEAVLTAEVGTLEIKQIEHLNQSCQTGLYLKAKCLKFMFKIKLSKLTNCLCSIKLILK
jgi:hypothetical protein